tara:strand:- start:1162 stop:1635 length:474 start_codon:yes stop_codon:yes gene_type:complete
MIGGIIYKLFCKDADEFYVGSSTEFHKRQLNHKTRCNNKNDIKHNYKVYQYIRNNGGYDNWNYEIVELGEYENKNCMKARESHFIKTLKPSLNSNIPNRSHKEYYEDNIEKINEKRKEKITCEICNCTISRDGLGRHKKSEKHIRNINNSKLTDFLN